MFYKNKSLNEVFRGKDRRHWTHLSEPGVYKEYKQLHYWYYQLAATLYNKLDLTRSYIQIIYNYCLNDIVFFLYFIYVLQSNSPLQH